MKGKLLDTHILMINRGASYNFLSSRRLNLPIGETFEFEVCLGDGHCGSAQGMCKGLKVNLGNYKTKVMVICLGCKNTIVMLLWVDSSGLLINGDFWLQAYAGRDET